LGYGSSGDIAAWTSDASGQTSTLSAAMNASCGMSTLPYWHLLLAFLLLLQKLALAGGVAAVAFGGHVIGKKGGARFDSLFSRNERHGRFAAVLIDQHEFTSVGRTKLFVRIQEFNSVNRAVRRNIHIQLVADTNGLDLRSA
jgi:hypothetical protein